jgi:hypothetical protein
MLVVYIILLLIVCAFSQKPSYTNDFVEYKMSTRRK